MNKKRALAFILCSAALLSPASALAHATVAPAITQPSKYENFTVSVPVEKEVPTTGIRILIPEGVDRVMPVVKPGWRVTITRDESDNVTQLEWRGGSIPPDQKDFFHFTARTAASSTSVVWKVYQTYQGGEIVAWDQDPRGEDVTTPYSITEIVENTIEKGEADRLPLVVSLAALLIAIVALVIATRKSA